MRNEIVRNDDLLFIGKGLVPLDGSKMTCMLARDNMHRIGRTNESVAYYRNDALVDCVRRMNHGVVPD